ncbi:MarC family protein, partial [Treponema pallidum]
MSTWTHIWSTAFTLLFIIDPIGNIPVVLSVLRTVPAER